MSQSSQYHLNLIELFSLHINEISYSIRHFWIILFYFIVRLTLEIYNWKNKFTYEILTLSVKTPPCVAKKSTVNRCLYGPPVDIFH